MPYKWMLFILLMGGIPILQAQPDKNTDFEPFTTVGAKFSTTFTRLNTSPVVNQWILPGYGAGLVFKNIAQPKLGFQLELNYMPKGWTELYSNSDRYTRRLHYLEMDFMTHVLLGKKRVRFFLNFGFLMSGLLAEQEQINITETANIQNHYEATIQNPFEYGLVLGFGGWVHTGIGNFQLEVRVHQSLLNLFRSDVFNISQNQVASASIAYLLPVQKGAFSKKTKKDKPEKIKKDRTKKTDPKDENPNGGRIRGSNSEQPD